MRGVGDEDCADETRAGRAVGPCYHAFGGDGAVAEGPEVREGGAGELASGEAEVEEVGGDYEGEDAAVFRLLV